MVLKNRLIIDNYQVTVSHRRDKNPRIYIYICRLIVLSGLDTVREEDEGKGRPRRNPNAIIYDASRFPRHVFRGFARTNLQPTGDFASTTSTAAHSEGRKSTKRRAGTAKGEEGRGGEKERGKMPVDKRGRWNEPKEARVLKCLFEFLRQVAISSERRSFEPAGVKRNHTDLHIMIYILVLCLPCSFASRRPRLPALDHAPRARLLFCLFFHPSPSPSPSPPTSSFSLIRAVGEPTVKLRIPFLWESWQIIAIFEKFGTIFFRGSWGK